MALITAAVAAISGLWHHCRKSAVRTHGAGTADAGSGVDPDQHSYRSITGTLGLLSRLLSTGKAHAHREVPASTS